ncbi:MAG TPA: hypothetical protein PLN89_03395, partial [Elusimicrobiota bacterium]|nr:hypothetical protein [Elusimicrobiota bacterium]
MNFSTNTGTWAASSYNANAGVFSTPNAPVRPDQSTWVWTRPKVYTLALVADGTSNCIALTERIVTAENTPVFRDPAPEAGSEPY